MKEVYHTHGPEETAALAETVLEACKNHKIFAIFGDLGAGKTVFVKAICKALGVEDAVTSPTFSIVNEYRYPGGQVWHFDFYRIKNLEEAYDLGYEEYFDSGAYCLIEWPERVEPLLPDDCVRIEIEPLGEWERMITLTIDPI